MFLPLAVPTHVEQVFFPDDHIRSGGKAELLNETVDSSET
jgi:hypothetical protein